MVGAKTSSLRSRLPSVVARVKLCSIFSSIFSGPFVSRLDELLQGTLVTLDLGSVGLSNSVLCWCRILPAALLVSWCTLLGHNTAAETSVKSSMYDWPSLLARQTKRPVMSLVMVVPTKWTQPHCSCCNQVSASCSTACCNILVTTF